METYLFLFNFTAFILFFSRITSSSLEIYNYIGNDSEHRVGWLYTKQYKQQKIRTKKCLAAKFRIRTQIIALSAKIISFRLGKSSIFDNRLFAREHKG